MPENYNTNYSKSAAQRAPEQEIKDEVSFNILEHLGVLRTSASGWTRELNYISWNDRPAKYDIRDWTPDHRKGTRGITLTDYEMGKVCDWVAARNAAADKE